jgi:hypothetical protein
LFGHLDNDLDFRLRDNLKIGVTSAGSDHYDRLANLHARYDCKFMPKPIETAKQITPDAILAGIGLFHRSELSALIAILEAADALGVAKGAVEDIGRRLRLIEADNGARLQAQAEELANSDQTDAALRHRLWYGLAKGLVTSTTTPFSSRSARKSAASMAVRASERLSPSLAKRRRSVDRDAAENPESLDLGRRASEIWKRTRERFESERPLPFPHLVEEVFLEFLANGKTLETVTQTAESEAARALAGAQAAAQRAMAIGGGWAAFAAIVGNAGFAPYIVAAQASAWIPLVGGPGLVSLLAVVVNPVTLFVGLGALAWLGTGRAASAVRSQMAARLCVLLAMRGAQDTTRGLEIFIGDMRWIAPGPDSQFSHLKPEGLHHHRQQVECIRSRIAGPMEAPAGAPPPPWNVLPKWTSAEVVGADIAEGLSITALTAGEMLWHAAAIDRNVLNAADFSRSADLGDPFTFAASAGDFAVRGAGYSLRGYTAERLVMDRLVADGHDVALAPASNTPGLDLVVDGAPVQVKCGTSLGILEEHFAKYPDIPVIANEALAEEAWQQGAGWSQLVTTVPGFDLGAIEANIAASLEHAAELADLDVLFFAFAAGGVRGGVEVWRGKITVDDLPAWLVIDGASRGALGLLGAKGGAWIGLIAIGPAGALVLGPVAACAALMGTGLVRERLTQALMQSWCRDLLELAQTLHRATATAHERRIAGLTKRYEELKQIAASPEVDLTVWMRRRAGDDLIAAIEELVDIAHPAQTENQVLELIINASRIAPGDADVLRARTSLERHLRTRPQLKSVVFGTHSADQSDGAGSSETAH